MPTTLSGVLLALTLALTLALPSAALAQPRLATIRPSAYDAEQKQAADAFLAARKQPVFGPFEPEMHSPRVMTPARELGDYLRFVPAIGNQLSEFEILLIAREWDQDYEWSYHVPIALKQGVSQAVVDAIGARRRPEAMSDDQAIIYDFTTQLLHTKRVSDPVYRRAQARFGDKGIVDITGLSGYYTLQAMVLNVAQTPPVEGAPVLPK